MLFVLYCLDQTDSPLRAELRDAHRAYLDQQPLPIFAAGPLLDDDGAAMIGSMLIIECEQRDEVDRFLAAEPYHQAGLFARVRIHRWERRR